MTRCDRGDDDDDFWNSTFQLYQNMLLTLLLLPIMMVIPSELSGHAMWGEKNGKEKLTSRHLLDYDD